MEMHGKYKSACPVTGLSVHRSLLRSTLKEAADSADHFSARSFLSRVTTSWKRIKSAP